MKLTYRIKKFNFENFWPSEMFVAQYNIFGLWVSIGLDAGGHLFIGNKCYCESEEEAHSRIELHKKNMLRSSYWATRHSQIIWSEK